jgi:YgiT-type zinc finger domain-containing protein
MMKCLICKQGETRPQRVTVPLQRSGTTIIFKEVPADVCENCGEYYLSEEITGRLLERAERAVQSGTEVEIVRFAA